MKLKNYEHRPLTTKESEKVAVAGEIAEKLDLIFSRPPNNPECNRHLALARTNLEQAIQWYVKAVMHEV